MESKEQEFPAFEMLSSEVRTTAELLTKIIVEGSKQQSSESKTKFFADLCSVLIFLLEGASIVAKREHGVCPDRKARNAGMDGDSITVSNREGNT